MKSKRTKINFELDYIKKLRAFQFLHSFSTPKIFVDLKEHPGLRGSLALEIVAGYETIPRRTKI